MTKFNVLLLAALIASCLYLVHIAYQNRRLYAELDRARNEQRALDTEFEKLKAEAQAQATPLRVERMARDKLAMRSVTPAVTQYVTLPAAPAASEAAR